MKVSHNTLKKVVEMLERERGTSQEVSVKPYTPPPELQPIPWVGDLEGRACLVSGPPSQYVSTLSGDPDLIQEVITSMANLHPEKKVLVLGHPPLQEVPGWTWEEVEASDREKGVKSIVKKMFLSLHQEAEPYVMIVVNLDFACSQEELFEGVREVGPGDYEETHEWTLWSRYLPALVRYCNTEKKETALFFTTSRRRRDTYHSDGHRSLPRTAFKFYSYRIFSLLRLTNEDFMEVKVMKDKLAPTTFWTYPMRRGEILSRAGVEAYSEEELKARTTVQGKEE